MIRHKKLPMVLWLASMVTFGADVSRLYGATPTEQVKTTADRVMEILKNSNHQGESNNKARREQLREAILPRFDFPEMAKRALGNQWKRNPEKQQEFVTAFTQLLEDSYADQLEAAKGDKIVYGKERREQDFAEVDTKVISEKGQETSINYKLHLVRDEWKAYDVVVENISLVNNYRSQFQRVLSTASLDELIRRMKEKKFEKTG
jgi:phospholipid transport system substrate-binding protein